MDGMLLLDSPADDPVPRALRARGLPVVFDGPPADPGPGHVWVDNDHTATTGEVLDHLASCGARRIALHAGYGRRFYPGAVTSAYEHWCAERRRTPLVIPFDPDDAAGHAFDPAFAGPDLPEAVYCVYDPEAGRCWPRPRATASPSPAAGRGRVAIRADDQGGRPDPRGCCGSAPARTRRTPGTSLQ
ncbi:hypothetical protein OTB20_20115 [Streptomyces sp. H27-H1]|uniref:hypothetical protein n=1 Tax=Streptomyces sp. H27-H1 TaxID=2996461 RepID=UPI002270EE81|nr:hypothetical protein [Streptomyces sp. H27-H1]MCY0928464.1 hypothetical protein [Streptomyces sp. H27-H1]